MKKRLVHRAIILGIILGTAVSCNYMDQFKFDKLSTEVEFEPSIAAPLAFGSFNLQDVLQAIDSTGLVEYDEDSLLYIYYTDTAYSVSAGEVVSVPNRITNETYIESDITSSGEWNLLPVGATMTFRKREHLDFEIEPGDKIDSVILSTGDLVVDIFSQFKHAGILTMTSGDIFDPQGDSLNLSFVISETDGSYTSTDNYDLTGYKMTFYERNDSAFADINYTLELTKSANPVTAGEECGISMNFENMDFSKIFGFIAAREVLNVQQSIDVKFYEGIADILSVVFQDPQLNLYVYNSYGIPLEIDLQNVTATSSYNQTSTDLTFKSDTMNPFIVKAPTVDQMGQTVTTKRSFNYQTTNIVDIIETAPDKFEFTVVANTGDTDMSGGSQSFVLDTSKMVIQAEIVLPMWLKTDGYELQDTIELPESLGLGNLNFVEHANLRLYTINELPLQVEVQAYFLDAAEQVIDSVFDTPVPLLEAAPVDANGEIIASGISEVLNEVDYTGEEIMALENATSLYIKAKAVTTDLGTTFVKFYSHYELNYRVNIAADFLINPSELDLGNQ